MNSIVIKGRLTKDPELRQTGNGTPVCTVSVAVDRRFSKEKETDFFTVVFWQKTAEFVSKYFSKGQEILVSGEMNCREYTDRDGNRRTAWELRGDNVEFCGSKGSEGSAEYHASAKKPAKAARSTALDIEADDDGDLPF